jgi:hypothetical protein
MWPGQFHYQTVIYNQEAHKHQKEKTACYNSNHDSKTKNNNVDLLPFLVILLRISITYMATVNIYLTRTSLANSWIISGIFCFQT